MPFYDSLDPRSERDRRTIEGLLRLKKAIAEGPLPRRTIDDSLVLATWNIREFDSSKYGWRTNESLLYIAETISCFDLVAVQEVREDLFALGKLINHLGKWWRYVMTDVTEGIKGNRERMVFLYDSRKITFGGLAGEIVIPPAHRENHIYDPAEQLARTPFIVGFSAGWFRFTLCTTHILYGEDKSDDPDRQKEIEMLAEFLAERAGEEYAWAKNMVLLGDFNIFRPEDETFKAITNQGFRIPKALQSLPSNVPQDKHYDQIAFIAPDIEDRLELSKAGVFNYYDHVYGDAEEAVYQEEMGEGYSAKEPGRSRTTHYRTWRTYQMSDHLPMWIELKIDFGEDYLRKKMQGEGIEEPVSPAIASVV
jgi:endonuclease/exonuclease/phosphatase family metal-dependent hydrolase